MRWFAVPGAASRGLDVVGPQTALVCACAEDSFGHDHRCLDRRRRVMRSGVDRPNAGTTWTTRRSASPRADPAATQDFEWSQFSADLATWPALLPVVTAASMAGHPTRIGCRGVESEGLRQHFVGPRAGTRGAGGLVRESRHGLSRKSTGQRLRMQLRSHSRLPLRPRVAPTNSPGL
jgi:hypothetical protein